MKDSQSDIYKSRTETRFSNVSPRELVLKYMHFFPWVALSIVIALVIAYVKLRYSPSVYSVIGTMVVQDPNPYNSKADKFNEIFFSGPDRKLNDEIQVIRSRNLARRVVRGMGLEFEYYNQGKIRSTLVYSGDSPIACDVLRIKDSTAPFSLQIIIQSEKGFKLDEMGPEIEFSKPFSVAAGDFVVHRVKSDIRNFASNKFFIAYQPLDLQAASLINSLSAKTLGESTNIIQLTYTTENPKSGIDIVNEWMAVYQKSGLEEKRQIAVNALNFIGEQMDTVELELNSVEKSMQSFRETNKIYNPEHQSETFFKSLSDLESQITAQGVRVENVNYLIRYLSDQGNPHRQVVSLLGIEEPSLAIQIEEFNRLQVYRETLLKTTTASNPLVTSLDASLEKLRANILTNLNNVKKSNESLLKMLVNKNSAKNREISTIPGKEKQLLDIARRQKILEELYSFLLQKKLETSIGAASTISNVKVIESALASDIPVLPNRRGTYLLSFFIGAFVPVSFFFLREYLNDKLVSREDIQRITKVPIIGELTHSEDSKTIVVTKHGRKLIAEQFRILRTNLQYVLPRKEDVVVLVTSSSSGEGKSFISTNLGVVMALAGKKTVILEFDIRKPKIMSSLNLANKVGITNYLIGKAKFKDIVVPVPECDNLYVIPCGAIPPNPSEMLLDPRLDELFREVKELFDFVVIDTAPVGLVSDSIVLSRFADVCFYIVRHDYTFKKQLQILNDIDENRKLPKVNLVVNDIKIAKGYGQYFGYGGYGYLDGSYGYGADPGSSYFDSPQPRKSFIRRLISSFRR